MSMMNDLINCYVGDDPEAAEELLKRHAKEARGMAFALVFGIIMCLGVVGIAVLITYFTGELEPWTGPKSDDGMLYFLVGLLVGLFMFCWFYYCTIHDAINRRKRELTFFYDHLEELGYSIEEDTRINVGNDDYEKTDKKGVEIR